MDAAWEGGIRHFDTADAYGGGRSETAIGKWIAARGVRPALTTKTFNPMDPDDEGGLAPERIARRLQSSLERLGVDSVELYLAHDFDPSVPLADTFGAFEAALTAGSINAYGVSNFDAAQLAAALRRGRAARDPELALTARSRRRGRAAAAVCRAGRRVQRVQPARGRMADRQVPPRRGLSGRLADDAAPGAVRAVHQRRRVRSARAAACARAARAICRCRVWRSRGCSPTSA